MQYLNVHVLYVMLCGCRYIVPHLSVIKVQCNGITCTKGICGQVCINTLVPNGFPIDTQPTSPLIPGQQSMDLLVELVNSRLIFIDMPLSAKQ